MISLRFSVFLTWQETGNLTRPRAGRPFANGHLAEIVEEELQQEPEQALRQLALTLGITNFRSV